MLSRIKYISNVDIVIKLFHMVYMVHMVIWYTKYIQMQMCGNRGRYREIRSSLNL